MAAIALIDLGWTPQRAREFLPFEATGLIPARVSLEHNHVYRVMTAGGEQFGEATGRLKHQAVGRRELPVVGDWVALRVDPAGGHGQICEILPRRSWFSRKTPGREGRETEEQVLAANIDTVFVVFGLDKPVNARAIERYLVVAKGNAIAPVIVLNKADLCQDLAEQMTVAAGAAGAMPVVAVSTKIAGALDELASYLQHGRTVALLGPSGVGKSSIVNRLISHELLPTGEVREWDGRGRHTSVHRQLVVRAAGGLIIDTPGIRELQLWETEAVADAFTDIAALADGCRFRNCGHATEPGCAVKMAVQTGSLDAERYASFIKLQEEQRAVKRMREERDQSAAKRVGRIGQKAMRALQKDRAREDR